MSKLAQECGAFLFVVYVGREYEFVHTLFADSEEILSGNSMLLHDLGRGFVEANRISGIASFLNQKDWCRIVPNQLRSGLL